MIKITTNKTKKLPDLIDPCKMLNTPHGTVFQQYVSGKPVQDFYISCGASEPSVVHIWDDSDDKTQRLSTDDLKSLRGLADHVKVAISDVIVEISINIGK